MHVLSAHGDSLSISLSLIDENSISSSFLLQSILSPPPPLPHCSTNVPRSYDDRLSKWCAVQRMRCKEFMAGDPKTPMTKAQYQALRGIGFNMDDKRKRYDRSVIDKKWEDKL
jgi:hypothetical protein